MDEATALERLRTPAARAAYAPVLPVLKRLREAGHEAVLVGGGVRDLLLGRRGVDWDVATSAPPEAMLDLWAEAVPTGLRHGTVTLPQEGGTVEITAFRTEGPYRDGRRPEWVRYGTSLKEDLSRRDFTVNAVAYDPLGDRLTDPFDGIGDISRRRLCTVGDPDRRFAEDGLRPLRGIRLAAVLEFDLDPGTREAMARAAEGVARVARERVREELMKLLKARRPSVGIELMRTTGILESVLPELLEEVGVEQNRFHAYDVYEHSLRSLDAAPAEKPLVRLAALLHDLGKPRTRVVEGGEGRFLGHEHEGARMAVEVLDRLRFPHGDRDHVVHLVAQHMFHYTSDWSEGAVRRFLRRVGPEAMADLFDLRRADDIAHGTGKDSEAEIAELGRRIAGVRARQEAFSVRDLEVDGHALMKTLGLDPGPEVGRILEMLLQRVLEDPTLNQQQRLLELARDLRPET